MRTAYCIILGISFCVDDDKTLKTFGRWSIYPKALYSTYFLIDIFISNVCLVIGRDDFNFLRIVITASYIRC